MAEAMTNPGLFFKGTNTTHFDHSLNTFSMYRARLSEFTNGRCLQHPQVSSEDAVQ